MLTGAFTATGQYSTVFVGMRGGFDVGITIGGGTNSLTLEKEVGGVWYTVGSAYTSTTTDHITPVDDYTPGTRFRLNGGTFDTGPITYQVQGDILAPEVTSGTVPGSLLLEQGDDLLLENGDYHLLEQA